MVTEACHSDPPPRELGWPRISCCCIFGTPFMFTLGCASPRCSQPKTEGCGVIGSGQSWPIWNLSKLVSWGCHNKLPQTDDLRQEKCILSQFWRPEVQSQGVGCIPPKEPLFSFLPLLPNLHFPEFSACGMIQYVFLLFAFFHPMSSLWDSFMLLREIMPTLTPTRVLFLWGFILW